MKCQYLVWLRVCMSVVNASCTHTHTQVSPTHQPQQKAKQLPASLLSTIWELFASQHNSEAGTLLALCAATSPSLFAPKLLALVASPGLEPIKVGFSCGFWHAEAECYIVGEHHSLLRRVRAVSLPVCHVMPPCTHVTRSCTHVIQSFHPSVTVIHSCDAHIYPRVVAHIHLRCRRIPIYICIYTKMQCSRCRRTLCSPRACVLCGRS